MFPETIHKQICRRRGFLIVLIFALAASTALFSRAEHLPIKTYTVADGLLRDTVYKIEQDSRGFLWFCTAEGISRFDGYGFTNFTVADGLPDGAVNDFLESGDDAIYLATDDGLAKLNPKGIRGAAGENQSAALFTVIKPDNPRAGKIQVLYKDAGGTIWVGTSDGLYKLKSEPPASAGGLAFESGDTNSKNDPPADANIPELSLEAVNLGELKNASKEIYITAIVKDRRGALWIGTSGGLLRLAADGRVSQFTTADGMPGDVIASLIETKDGKLWAGMRWDGATAGLVLLNPEAADGANKTPVVKRAFTAADGLPTYWIPAMLNTSDGKFWLATVAGLCEWQGENAKSVCKTYRAENDLCNNDVWSLAEDKDGNLWTGSRCGAKKIARYGFTSYGAADGIETLSVNTIFENRNDEFFVAIANHGRTIYRFDDNKFTAVTPHVPPDIGWGSRQTVWQDSSGAWLAPTAAGLFRFAVGTRFEDLARTMPQKFSPATRSKEIFRVFEDSRGDIWIATWDGSGTDELWRWRREANVWEDLTERVALAKKHSVTSFVEDRSGSLWIATGADDKGAELIRYRDGEFKIFTEKENLPDGWVRDLYVDRAGRLWLANNKHGLLRLDDVNADELNLVRYSRAEGLSSAGAYCVTEDAFGRIYVGSARGVDRLNPDTGQIENFTTADGLPASSVEIAYRDRNNNLWFGTAKGLTKFVPEPQRQRKPPMTLITALRVNGEPQNVSILGEVEIPPIELNAEQKQVSIDFIGLGASLGEQLKYEYRFGGGEWTQTNERTVNFANLAAGSYQFEIRAVTADRLTSLPAVVSFKIAAPFYLRPLFLLAAFLIFGGLMLSLYRYRVSRLLEMERMRTRIATDLHDDIGANLTKISILSEVAHQRLGGANEFEEANLLENIAETSRESVSAMSDIVWAINPKKDSLADLTVRMRRHAEELLERREINLVFNASPDAPDLKLDANLRRNIYLIFKESLNNIVRHAEAENVEINFKSENGKLSLEIADDGRGFEISDESDGNGLANMRKRAAELGGNLEIISSRTKGATMLLVLSPAFRRI